MDKFSFVEIPLHELSGRFPGSETQIEQSLKAKWGEFGLDLFEPYPEVVVLDNSGAHAFHNADCAVAVKGHTPKSKKYVFQIRIYFIHFVNLKAGRPHSVCEEKALFGVSRVEGKVDYATDIHDLEQGYKSATLPRHVNKKFDVPAEDRKASRVQKIASEYLKSKRGWCVEQRQAGG